MDDSEIFETHHFVIVKRFLMITCIWPYQNRTLKFYGRAFMIFAIHTMLIPLITKFYEEWHKVDRDSQILVENITAFLFLQAILFKMYIRILIEKKLKHIYEEMMEDFKEIQELVERVAMVKLWKSARNLSIIYASYMFAGLFIIVFTPQAVPAISDMIWPMNDSRPKMICYYTEYFIDQDEYLVYLIFHTFVVAIIVFFILVSSDTSFVTVTYHVLGLFNLLTFRLRQIDEWAEIDSHQKDEQIHNFVIGTIEIHIKTLEFAKKVRLAYNEGNFISFGFALVGLSIGTNLIISNIMSLKPILRLGFLWIGTIFYLFFMNWPGQRFLDASDDLSKSIYFCRWYKLPAKTQFLLRVMMMRCLAPCQLTAGPVFQLSFAYCGAILRTAFHTSWQYRLSHKQLSPSKRSLSWVPV